MKIPSKTWQNYIKRLAKINTRAAGDVVTYMTNHDVSTYEGTKALIDYAYAVSTKYGEAAAELSCQMYDAIATASKAAVPAAEPAATATYGEIAKTIYGTMVSTKKPEAVGAAVGRSVKLASVDTLQQNALRDGAEWAWIPSGDSCAYCTMLASRGWVKASKKAIKNGHAEHVHNNCDCAYCVRFDNETSVEGYDPDALYEEWKSAGNTSKERLNALRRQFYAENKDYINAQKRAAYAKRIELKNDYSQDDKRYAKVMSLTPVELESLAKNDIINKIKTYQDAANEISKLGIAVDDSIYGMELNALKHSVSGVARVVEEFPKIDIRRILITNSEDDYGEFGYKSLYMYFSKNLLNGKPELAFPAGLHESGHAVDRYMSNKLLGQEKGYASSVVQQAINNLKLSGAKEDRLRLSLSNTNLYMNNEEVYAGAFELWGARRDNPLSQEIIRITKEDYNNVVHSK